MASIAVVEEQEKGRGRGIIVPALLLALIPPDYGEGKFCELRLETGFQGVEGHDILP